MNYANMNDIVGLDAYTLREKDYCIEKQMQILRTIWDRFRAKYANPIRSDNNQMSLHFSQTSSCYSNQTTDNGIANRYS